MLPWDSAIHQSQVRFNARAEREEYEQLLRHPARVLQDRMADAAGRIEPESLMSRSGRRCTKRKHSSADCCIRGGYWPGVKRSVITLPTNNPS
jgi:hypothetical protein